LEFDVDFPYTIDLVVVLSQYIALGTLLEAAGSKKLSICAVQDQYSTSMLYLYRMVNPQQVTAGRNDIERSGATHEFGLDVPVPTLICLATCSEVVEHDRDRASKAGLSQDCLYPGVSEILVTIRWHAIMGLISSRSRPDLRGVVRGFCKILHAINAFTGAQSPGPYTWRDRAAVEGGTVTVSHVRYLITLLANSSGYRPLRLCRRAELDCPSNDHPSAIIASQASSSFLRSTDRPLVRGFTGEHLEGISKSAGDHLGLERAYDLLTAVATYTFVGAEVLAVAAQERTHLVTASTCLLRVILGLRYYGLGIHRAPP